MNSNKLIKLDKQHMLIQIIYYLFMILFLATQYEKTNYKWFFYMELLTMYMIFATVIRYITLYKQKRHIQPKIVQKNTKKRPTTPLDKEFRKNYIKTNSRNIHKEPVPDQKSAYIQSAWDEVEKI